MSALRTAGFYGNTIVNGEAAISANLAVAKGETKVYTSTGRDSENNIPIYSKLKVTNDGTSMTFTYTVTYDNPATPNIEVPKKLRDNHAIYNTGTSTQTMFTLGSGFGKPSNVTNYITDSNGNKVASPKPNSTPIVERGNGYTWSDGFQMNGFQAKRDMD